MRYGIALFARFGQFARSSRKAVTPDAFDLRLARLGAGEPTGAARLTPFRALA